MVAAILPSTEAAREAILINFLVAFGAMAGRGPYTIAGNARHGVNLFGVLTGATSGGRKGTSQAAISSMLCQVDSDFMKNIDYIIVGDGYAALFFAHQLIKNNKSFYLFPIS